MLKFSLPYPPSVNHYLVHSHKGVFRTTVAKNYREQVGWHLLACGIHSPLKGLLSVSIRVYRPRKIGDIDGILKVSLDAMQDYAYENDSQIIDLHVRRLDDKNNPRLDIEIEEVKLW